MMFNVEKAVNKLDEIIDVNGEASMVLSIMLRQLREILLAGKE